MKKLIFLFLTSIMSSGILSARAINSSRARGINTTTFQNNLDKDISISRKRTNNPNLTTSQISRRSSVQLNTDSLRQDSTITINVDGKSFVLKSRPTDTIGTGTYIINNLTTEIVLTEEADEFGIPEARRISFFKLLITTPSNNTIEIYPISTPIVRQMIIPGARRGAGRRQLNFR
ncbi:MAG: hypothetical protein WC436_03895 [Candidatus Babeliales bacterium]